jgi:hypothetical protein
MSVGYAQELHRITKFGCQWAMLRNSIELLCLLEIPMEALLHIISQSLYNSYLNGVKALNEVLACKRRRCLLFIKLR